LQSFISKELEKMCHSLRLATEDAFEVHYKVDSVLRSKTARTALILSNYFVVQELHCRLDSSLLLFLQNRE